MTEGGDRTDQDEQWSEGKRTKDNEDAGLSESGNAEQDGRGEAGGTPGELLNEDDADAVSDANHRFRFPGAAKQGAIKNMFDEGSDLQQENPDRSENGGGTAENDTSDQADGENSDRATDHVQFPDSGHGLEHAVYGAVGVFGVAAVAAVAIVIRRRRGQVLPAAKGDSQGNYVAIEMQADPAGEDDFGVYSVVGNLDEQGLLSEAQGEKPWEDGDGWDEFDTFDESPALPTLTAYERNGVKCLLDLERCENGDVKIMVTFKGSSPEEINPFSCKFAVPQHLELHVGPPSSTSLAGHGGALTQSLVVSRRAGGGSKKPLKLRLLIEYQYQGKLLRETADVKDFPADL